MVDLIRFIIIRCVMAGLAIVDLIKLLKVEGRRPLFLFISRFLYLFQFRLLFKVYLTFGLPTYYILII